MRCSAPRRSSRSPLRCLDSLDPIPALIGSGLIGKPRRRIPRDASHFESASTRDLSEVRESLNRLCHGTLQGSGAHGVPTCLIPSLASLRRGSRADLREKPKHAIGEPFGLGQMNGVTGAFDDLELCPGIHLGEVSCLPHPTALVL